MHARLLNPETDIHHSLSLHQELLMAFISAESPQAILQLVKEKPELLTNEWFIMIETLLALEKNESAKQHLGARLETLKQIRYTQAAMDLLIDFANADWASRRQLLTEYAKILLNESVESLLGVLLQDGADANVIEQLRALLGRCRTWGIDTVWYFNLGMHMGGNVDLPAAYEASVMQIASLLSRQQEDQTVLAQAIEALQLLLGQLPADVPSLFRAALLHDLADGIEALPTDHPVRKLDQIEAYYREALLAYQAAGRLLSVASIQHSLGIVLSEQGRYDAALELLQAVIQGWRGNEYHKSDAAWALTAYASVLDYAGRIEEALAAYNEAIMLLPDTPPLLRSRAETLIHARRLDEAEADLARAIELDGNEDSPYLWERRAQLAIARGDGVLADKLLDEVSSRGPSLDVIFLRARSAWLQGNINAACNELRRALDKANQEARNVMRREMEHFLNEHASLVGQDEIRELLGEFTAS